MVMGTQQEDIIINLSYKVRFRVFQFQVFLKRLAVSLT